MMFPKPTWREVQEYKAWLRPGGCVVKSRDCYGGLEFHHEKRRGARGSDPLLGGSTFCGMWLCWHHHMIAQSNLPQFEAILGTTVWEFLFRQFYRYACDRGLLEMEGGKDETGEGW